MAANNFISWWTDNNWGTTNNWSLGAVPTASDWNVATFTVSSPNCVVNTSSRVCNAIDFTAYTNTITMSQLLSVSGNVTFGSGMHVSGSGALTVAAASTIESNSFVFPNTLNLTATVTYAIGATNLYTSGMLNISTSSTSPVVNGNNIYMTGGLTIAASGANVVTGTTQLWLQDGTWSHTNNGVLRCPITINPTWTVILGTNIYYNTWLLKYTAWAGSITTTWNLISISVATTLDTSWMTRNNVTLSGNTFTLTLSSALNIGWELRFSWTSSGTMTLTGNYNINVWWNLLFSSLTSGIITWTSTFVLNGTGSWTMPVVTTGVIQNKLTINTAGTITLWANIQYGTWILTYTAGTVDFVTNNNTLYLWTCTLNLWGITVNNVNLSRSSTWTYTLTSGFSIAWLFSNMNAATHQSIVSSSGGTRRAVILLPSGTQDLTLLDATDIDSSWWQTIFTARGTLSNTINWQVRMAPVTVANTF